MPMCSCDGPPHPYDPALWADRVRTRARRTPEQHETARRVTEQAAQMGIGQHAEILADAAVGDIDRTIHGGY